MEEEEIGQQSKGISPGLEMFVLQTSGTLALVMGTAGQSRAEGGSGCPRGRELMVLPGETQGPRRVPAGQQVTAAGGEG